MLGFVGRLPDPQCEAFFAQVGGAQAQVPDDATAYQGRSAAFVVNVHGRWAEPAQDDTRIGWCRDLCDATAPHATGEACVGRLEAAYGSSYQRLVERKNRYDAGDLFRMHQHIRPTAGR